MTPQYPPKHPGPSQKISIFWPPGPPGGRRPTGIIVINSAGNGVRQAIALTIFMNIVRAFPCLTPFPAEFFRILTPGASWRPKADRFFVGNMEKYRKSYMKYGSKIDRFNCILKLFWGYLSICFNSWIIIVLTVSPGALFLTVFKD